MTRLMRIAAVPLLALALTACGPAASKTEVATAGGKPTGSAQQSGNLKDKQRRFAQCMRKNGVDMPDPKAGKGAGLAIAGGGPGESQHGDGKAQGPDPIQQKAMEKAMEACRKFMPDPAELPKPKPEDLKKMHAFSKCMRDHGARDFPDPDANGGIQIGKEGGLDPGSPAVQKAQQACQKLSGGAPMAVGAAVGK